MSGTPLILGTDHYLAGAVSFGNLLLFDHWDADARETVTAQYVINGANQVECIDTDGSGDSVCDEASKWQYDAYGNLRNDHVTQYEYDAAGRMSSTTIDGGTTIYTYNGDGERISQSVSTTVDNIDITRMTTYVLDVAASTMLSETTTVAMETSPPVTESTAHYLNGISLIAQQAVKIDSTTVSYFQYDGAGSVRQTTDPAGLVQSTQTFDPYGNPYVMPGSDEAMFGFGGAMHDVNGLIYQQGQYYNPSIGRSVQFGLCSLFSPWCQRYTQSQIIAHSPYASPFQKNLANAYIGLSVASVPLTVAAAVTSAPVLPGVATAIGTHSVAISTTFAFGYTYGSELLNNVGAIEQEGFWAAQTHLNWGRIGIAPGITAMSGGLGRAAGAVSARGLLRAGAALYGTAVAANVLFGLADMPGPMESRFVRGVAGGYGDDFGEAVLHTGVRRNLMASRVYFQGGGAGGRHGTNISRQLADDAKYVRDNLYAIAARQGSTTFLGPGMTVALGKGDIGEQIWVSINRRRWTDLASWLGYNRKDSSPFTFDRKVKKEA